MMKLISKVSSPLTSGVEKSKQNQKIIAFDVALGVSVAVLRGNFVLFCFNRKKRRYETVYHQKCRTARNSLLAQLVLNFPNLAENFRHQEKAGVCDGEILLKIKCKTHWDRCIFLWIPSVYKKFVDDMSLADSKGLYYYMTLRKIAI